MKDYLNTGRLFSDRYRVEAKIGEGGMGIVFQAWDVRLDRRVAIKVLPSLDRVDRIARFTREARAVARLSHPNIVALYDHDQVDGLPFMVMEFLEGLDLRQVGFPGVPELLQAIEQVCAALNYAHGQRVVHRDIKPENIVLTRSGAVKVLDFGLAMYEGAGKVTRTGVIPGTFPYLAPELISGATPTPLSDQYAVGVLTYELLSGEYPFPTDNMQLSLLHRTGSDPYSLSLVRPDLPPALVKAIDRSLSRIPDRRFESIGELQTELEAVRIGLSGTAAKLPVVGALARSSSIDSGAATRPVGAIAPEMALVNTPRSGTATELPDEQTVEPPAVKPGFSLWFIPIAVALLVVGVVIGVLASDSGEPKRRRPTGPVATVQPDASQPTRTPLSQVPRPIKSVTLTLGGPDVSAGTKARVGPRKPGLTLRPSGEVRLQVYKANLLKLAHEAEKIGDCRRLGAFLTSAYRSSDPAAMKRKKLRVELCSKKNRTQILDELRSRGKCEKLRVAAKRIFNGRTNRQTLIDAWYKGCLNLRRGQGSGVEPPRGPLRSDLPPPNGRLPKTILKQVQLAADQRKCELAKRLALALRTADGQTEQIKAASLVQTCFSRIWINVGKPAFLRGDCKTALRIYTGMLGQNHANPKEKIASMRRGCLAKRKNVLRKR